MKYQVIVGNVGTIVDTDNGFNAIDEYNRAVTRSKTEVFTFSELSDSAKENAREWWREVSAGDYAWSTESLDSIEKFCEEFGVKLTDYSVGPYSSPEYKTNADNSHFRGRKLREFSRDAMPTGYCLDCDLYQTFCDEFKRTGDAKGAFDKALYAGFIAWRDDMESQESDEYIDDCLIANEYEFDSEGHRA